MSNDKYAADGSNGRLRAYSVKTKAKARSSTSCAFCWFVLTIYPTLKGMTTRDESTYRAHLKQSHGLTGEIQV